MGILAGSAEVAGGFCLARGAGEDTITAGSEMRPFELTGSQSSDTAHCSVWHPRPDSHADGSANSLVSRFKLTSASTGRPRSHLVNWASIRPAATLAQ